MVVWEKRAPLRANILVAKEVFFRDVLRIRLSYFDEGQENQAQVPRIHLVSVHYDRQCGAQLERRFCNMMKHMVSRLGGT